VNDELEWFWKAGILAEFKVLSRHLLGNTEENGRKPVRIAGLQTEI
jgi:hypothetical protein